MKRPLITLLTDFGAQDHYVAAMKGVILGICPQANIVDITHQIPPFQIASGAYTLAQAVTAFPRGSIHVAVVDPGVGSSRRAIAARAAGQIYIGPDNGLLAMALEAAGKPAIFEITNQKLFLNPVSKTFHGRDIFAPAAAHLARGLAIAKLGPRQKDWQTAQFLKPRKTGPREWIGAVLSVDVFGNVVTNYPWSDFSDVATSPFQLSLGKALVRVFADNYDAGPLNRPFVVRGSGEFLEICVKQGSAAELTDTKADTQVKLKFL